MSKISATKSTFKITQSMVKRFALISGDTNPLHINKQFAQKSLFKRQIAHGMLALGYLQKIILSQPNYQLKQMQIQFYKPIYLEDQIQIQFQPLYFGEIKDQKEKQIQFIVKIRKSDILTTKISGKLSHIL